MARPVWTPTDAQLANTGTVFDLHKPRISIRGAEGWGYPSPARVITFGRNGRSQSPEHADKPRRGVHCWPKSGPANAAFGSFFTLSKRKGTPASFRLKTARSTISR